MMADARRRAEEYEAELKRKADEAYADKITPKPKTKQP